jgi:hypothetical protein
MATVSPPVWIEANRTFSCRLSKLRAASLS